MFVLAIHPDFADGKKEDTVSMSVTIGFFFLIFFLGLDGCTRCDWRLRTLDFLARLFNCEYHAQIFSGCDNSFFQSDLELTYDLCDTTVSFLFSCSLQCPYTRRVCTYPSIT
jgi:hypothetical protein